MQPTLEDNPKHAAVSGSSDGVDGVAAAPGADCPTRTLEDLEDEIAELAAHIDAATYRLLRAISEFDRRDGWGTGFCSCAHWLSFRVGICLVTAREKVRVARALDDLPRISEALARGCISYSKVRELTRIATLDNEENLVELALAGTAAHVQRVVRAYRRTEQAELETAELQREGRYLNLYTDDNGMLVVEGRLPAEVGALLTRAVEAAEQELWQHQRQRARDASAGASADTSGGGPDASPEASADTSGGGPDASAEAPADAGTAGQRRADALAGPGLCQGRASWPSGP